MRVLIWMCLLGCGSANPAPTQPAPEETEETEEAEVTEAAPLRCSVRHDAADPDMMGAEEDWVRDEAGRWVSHGAVSDGPALSARWTYGPEEIRFTVDFGEDRDEGVLRVSREGARVLVRQEAIIGSMTKAERRNAKLLKGSRKRRIAAGSGTTVQDVNRLLKQFTQMQKMMKKISRGGGLNFGSLMGGRGMPGGRFF